MNKFRKRVQIAFNEWKKKGYCKDAMTLNHSIGKEYFDTANPHFFTGNINSDLVLINLNPKRNISDWHKQCDFPDFQSYWQAYERFGEIHYGKESNRMHKSPFDYKLIRFLRPFGLLSLNNSDKYQNLENVIDSKLQLELVPFGSPSFIYQSIGIKHLNPFVDSILSLIFDRDRKYVIFCGRVFEQVLSDFIVHKSIHSFRLNKKDGHPTKSNFQVINIILQKEDKRINACIAPQFAKHGYPEAEYGQKVKELYSK